MTTIPLYTLSNVNKRRTEIIFEFIYCDLYTTYRNVLFSETAKTGMQSE